MYERLNKRKKKNDTYCLNVFSDFIFRKGNETLYRSGGEAPPLQLQGRRIASPC